MKKGLRDRVIARLGRYFLEKNALANRQDRVYMPISEAKKVGIVYNALEPEEAKLVMEFALGLEKMGKTVNTLGYINRKSLDGEFIPNYRNDYYCNRDLNWLRLPKEISVKRFISESYDYLINLYTRDDFAMIGISALSMARFRIGLYWKSYTECFDMMLKPSEEGMEAYLKEIKHYLKIKNEQ